ncbi:MAG: hypothetical protein M1820_000302 [Bogoriella megaspora]|nr:MAG: hypothetical protein M1820_000302 [Bogoriella megaspora]
MSGGRTQSKMSTTGKAMEGARKQAGSPADTTQKKPAPKAWTQGNNPLTQKAAGSSVPNGAANAPRNGTSPKPTQSQTKEPSQSEKQAHDRLVYLMANFIGNSSVLTLKSGEKYSGIFSGINIDSPDSYYIIKMAKRAESPSNAVNGTNNSTDDYLGAGEDHMLTFLAQDVVDLALSDVLLEKTTNKSQNGVASSFKTDADISGNLAVRERNLQRWAPSADSNVDLSLEGAGAAGWDQFEVNDRLFGVKTSYDEHHYTTRIDKTDPSYSEKAARAAKIAREIEGSAPMNAHVAEERNGSNPLDSGIDEEDKYSGVKRDFPALSSGQPNKYTPPARRAPTGQATVPGAPVDPAIISSQLSKPNASSTSTGESQSATLPSEQPDKDVAISTQKADAPSVSQDAAKAVSTAPIVSKDTSGIAPATETKPTPASTGKPVLGSSGRQYGQGQNATENVEKHLLDSFKAFSASEKMKMFERQRAQQRTDKAVKLNDLKKFSQNFKLHTPVPTDLVPILAKDKSKQEQIVEKTKRQLEEQKEQEQRKASTTASDSSASASKATRGASAAVGSPTANIDRSSDRTKHQPYNSQSVRGNKASYNTAPMQGPRDSRQPGQLGPRLQMTQQQHKAGMAGGPPPIAPQNIHIPIGPSQPNSALTPGSAASLRPNAKAFEFRPNPAASTFTPTGPGGVSSPPPNGEVVGQPRPSKAGSFFEGKTPKLSSERPSIDKFFMPIKRMKKDLDDSGKGKDFSTNAGLPQAFRTAPTWDVPTENQEKKYTDIFEKPQPAVTSVSPMRGSPANAPMAHQYQLPAHLQQGAPSQHTPHHTPRHYPVQPQVGSEGPSHYESQRMQISHSSSSHHPSPRFMPPMLAYNPGMPPQMQQQYGPPMAAPYNMSPGNHHAQYRPGPQPQFVNAQGPPMGGQMMVQQPSGGPFMQGVPMFQPMPGNPQSHFGGPPPGSGYASPRPVHMSHQNSQQGHGPPQQIVYMQPQQHASGPPMIYPQQGGPSKYIKSIFLKNKID